MLKIGLVTLALLASVSPLQAQEKGQIVPVQILCSEIEDALVGASKAATDGKQAFQQYLAEPDNTCQMLPEHVGAKYVREVRSIVGKMMNIKVHEVENRHGQKYYIFEVVRDTGA